MSQEKESVGIDVDSSPESVGTNAKWVTLIM